MSHNKLYTKKQPNLLSCHGSPGERGASLGEILKKILLKSLPCFAAASPGENKECRRAMNYGRRAMEDIFDQLRTWLILGQVNKSFR